MASGAVVRRTVMTAGAVVVLGAFGVAGRHASPVAADAGQVRPILPPHPDGPIWGDVDPLILGTCSAAVHDLGRGSRRRRLPLSHLASAGGPERLRLRARARRQPGAHDRSPIAASPVRFGYIGRRHPTADEPNGHEEAHEGFKVFIANAAT